MELHLFVFEEGDMKFLSLHPGNWEPLQGDRQAPKLLGPPRIKSLKT
jgi:hypothetical protein